MSRPLRQLSLATVAALGAGTFACAAAAAAVSQTVAPLPESSYTVRAACAQPAPLHAGCLADQLVPATAEARRHDHPIGQGRPASSGLADGAPSAGSFGYRPSDLHAAYRLPDAPATGQQTIALVDAFNDLTATSDLAAYEHEFGLTACPTTTTGCFKRVNQSGGETTVPFPKTLHELETAASSTSEERRLEAAAAKGWGVEISLDVQTARAICQTCHIILIEAKSTAYADLEEAEATASALGATVISNSWGGPQVGISAKQDEESPFNRPDTVITASVGDDGFLGWDAENSFERGYAEYPAASPRVVAVGGTRLTVASEDRWASETVWNGDGATGGGCAETFTAPSWQQALPDWSAVGCASKRAEADVSADGDPYSGVAITDNDDPGESCQGEYEHRHWCTYGGTSLASPLIASAFALAGGANGVAYPAKTLYESRANAPGTLHDVTSGSNGKCTHGFNSEGYALCTVAEEAHASCSGTLVCLAAIGYDGPSGVGTPNGVLAFEPGQHETPPAATPPAAPAPEPAPIVEAPPASVAAEAAPVEAQVSSLALTHAASSALRHHRPSVSRVAFSFRLNVASRVRVTLAVQVRSHGRLRWVLLALGDTIRAAAGHDASRLSGRHSLPAGFYRLTLTPTGGRAHWITLRVL